MTTSPSFSSNALRLFSVPRRLLKCTIGFLLDPEGQNVEIDPVLTFTMRVQYSDVNQRARIDCVRDEGHYGDYPAGGG
jgi:hypothetical protein